TGAFEAVERRDGDKARYLGKGVSEVVAAVTEVIAPEILGLDAADQRYLDATLIELDGTPHKGKPRANAILRVSRAPARASAETAALSLLRYFGGPNADVLPIPMTNILPGGSHAVSSVDVQEFRVAPIGAGTFKEALRWGTEVYHSLK